MRVMHLFVVSFFQLFTLLGQSNLNLDLIGDNQDLPQIHANGVYKFFVESDNLLRFGNSERAVLILDNAIAQHPFLAEAYLKRAELFFKIGRTEAGKQDLEKAMRLNPYVYQLNGPQRNLYLTELIVGDTSFYREIITEIHDYDPLLSSYLRLTVEKLSIGAMELAENYLREAFELEPDPSGIMHHLSGNIQLLKGAYDQAYLDYTKAIELDPEVGLFYYKRGISQLFTYNRNTACKDLAYSSQIGYAKSTDKLAYFCFN